MARPAVAPVPASRTPSAAIYAKNCSLPQVDILRNDVCDISMNLQLTERVLVSTDGSVSSVVEAIAGAGRTRNVDDG